MSRRKSKKHEDPPTIPPTAGHARKWALPGVAGLTIVTAVWSYARVEEREAAPGSPYYDKAVREAVHGLANPGARGRAAAPADRPPLAAGLDPADYYWCENCQTYHKRGDGAAGHAPPAAEVPGAGAAPPFAIPIPGAAQEAAGSRPPLPEGLDPAEHYWCENCQTYHRREGAPAADAPSTPD